MQRSAGISLILGGARSGKSTFAERLADESGLGKFYLATSEVLDGEMENRVALHRKRRGREWRLVEEPLALAERLSELAAPDRCILVDCLTLWLTNVMMTGGDVETQCHRLIQTLAALPGNCTIILVSNEVGQGIVPMEKLARDFRDHAGRLHQDVAAVASNVWFVTAGLPQKLK